MGSTVVNIIIHPLFNYQFPAYLPMFEEGISMVINLNSTTLVRNISQVVMSEIGLEHLTRHSQAYIQVPPANSFVHSTSFPDPFINIGTIETWINSSPTVKILTIGKVEEFCGIEGISNIDFNLFNSVVNNYSLNRDEILNPFIKNALESMSNFTILSSQNSSIFHMNQMIVKELQMLARNRQQTMFPFNMSNTDDNMEKKETSLQVYPIDNTLFSRYREFLVSLQSPSDTSVSNQAPPIPVINNLLEKTFNTRRKIRFDPKKEIPILEQWFERVKLPKTIQLKQLADQLNSTSNRSPEDKITWKNLKYWFSYRRVKERRCKKDS